MDNKIIMLFLDLEGTIIEEEYGKVKPENINKLLDSINELQQTTNLTVKTHIASPVSASSMNRILDELDYIIVKYNRKNGSNIKEIESAVAHPDSNYVHQEDLYDRIFPMKIPREDFGRVGKLNYVKQWVKMMEDQTKFIIYGGNGLNDVGAMNYIKSTKKGFVICPKNSDEEVKKIADFVSEKEEAEGIKDGMDCIIKQIKLRTVKEQGKKEAPNFDDDEEGLR